ncbi:MAG: mechanosensitive ion channel [Gammaproteobacteria bacterium]|nr:mechanosensitive ion channel [Gammaproteobacteria bacterium]MCP5136315.1 mechanosensitive ion channel [Gammaproteobacteria bacterium]
MTDAVSIEKLRVVATEIYTAGLAKAVDPWFWSQFGIIAVIFVVARWLLTPGLQRLLSLVLDKIKGNPGLHRVVRRLHSLSNTITWLFLQWMTIGVVSSFGWPHAALTVVTSLLSAWLMIRLATLLVVNRGVSRAISIIAWTVAALNIVGWLAPAMSMLDSWSFNAGTLRISPLTLIKAGLALWFALWLAGTIASIIERQLERSAAVSPAMKVLGAKLVRISLILFAILIALSAVGIDLTALAVFSGALGVGLGFGLQKIFSNLVSGVILLMDRSIKPGDVISVGQTFGWINHLGARYASVITRDGIEHLIPNEELITQRVENWSYSDNLVRLRIPVGISYNADPRLAQRLCIEAALDVERVERTPEPKCQLTAFGNSSVDLELRVWIDDPPLGRGNVINDVLLGVWDRFHAHGIEIPFPQQDLHLRSAFGATDMAGLKRAWQNGAADDGAGA